LLSCTLPAASGKLILGLFGSVKRRKMEKKLKEKRRKRGGLEEG